ncbi:uncharacterized protein LOC116295299 isoform X2 [Actinia tenebrosa]|uniref:Uncharacterized protein LOC116295299 isoform X2 n=1 Tax=Actinia tenebrosa TaxID=6105 RepID=A0A6P8I259_ACTTE|nr:uncharacterized protein LOC116295299 isoform X2 [Actinia tenebrosa]
MKKSDPFEVEPLPKAFYYPSKEKELSKKEKKVCLSAPYTSKDTQHQVSSPEDLKFLKETNTLRTAQEIPTRENGSTADLSSTSQFNESWPSTERTGSLGTPLSDGTVSSPEMSQQMREWLEGQEKPVGNSTLGWYINRFRNAPPTDRQKRDQASFISKKKPNFWWLSPPSGPSTPSGQSTPVPGHTPPQKLPLSPMKPPSPTTMKRDRYTSAMSSPSSVHVDDGTTAELDRRAKELLEKSETSVETISTEPFPLPLKKPAEHKPAQHMAGLSGYKLSPQKTKIPTAERSEPISHQNPWPEDDILYQWRLARRMEKAQEKVSGLGVRVHVKKTDPYNIRRPVDVTHRASSQPFSITLPGLNTFDDVLPGPSGVSTLPGQPRPEVTPQVFSSTAVQTPSVTTTASSNMDDTIRGSHAPVSMVTSYGTSTRSIVTPVISRPCQHLESNVDEREANIYQDKLWPHMHLACDILPCQCTGDAKMHHHHHHQKHEKHKINEDRASTNGLASDVNDHVKQQNDEEKETDIPQNEIPQCKKSHFKSALSKKTTDSNREENQENKKTSSSLEDLSSSTETESERETRIPRRKGKLKQVDNKEKRKENKTSEMVQNVIGKVISEHMFSGSSSTSDNEEKRTTGLEGSGTNEKSTSDNEEKRTTGLEASGTNEKSKHPTFTLDQADSSEEEFSNDEILKILRQRSKDLKKELRIDNLLEEES